MSGRQCSILRVLAGTSHLTFARAIPGVLANLLYLAITAPPPVSMTVLSIFPPILSGIDGLYSTVVWRIVAFSPPIIPRCVDKKLVRNPGVCRSRDALGPMKVSSHTVAVDADAVLNQAGLAYS
ncbi:uncharacterized protein B0H18DRAFT_114188 [Fomitopsis serialis]|uniref:uncharacterized protein n=1 Tax=Fomitopsis serialis TaxID=139415 RepID=UPI002007714C|nr:uncharacterized protein B0H18DRAFT_114188 [Neoantrodia serialis]KAH9914927.1 hypothetical protein B0H18DRAFT_114188 [Neoantrodia serialis]